MKGRIHSLESFGTVDGPGTRFVVFVQGCPLRCTYCHNPDTWSIEGGTMMEPREIFVQYERNQAFYKSGGITVTGGEPLMQLDFLIELFTIAREKQVHTCIDTSGIVFNSQQPAWMKKLDELMELTDLVLLDIKHIDSEQHTELTGKPNERVLEFAEYLNKKQVDMWIRHVVVPDLTYNEKYLRELGAQLRSYKNIKALDVLPYHDMAISKYEGLGEKYPLEGVRALTKDEALQARIWIVKGYRNID